MAALEGVEFPLLVVRDDGQVTWISRQALGDIPFLLDWEGRSLCTALGLEPSAFPDWLAGTAAGRLTRLSGPGGSSPTLLFRGRPLPEPEGAGHWLLNVHQPQSEDRRRAEREILLRIGSIPLSLLMEETIALTAEQPGRCPITGDMLGEVTSYIGAWGGFFLHDRHTEHLTVVGQVGWPEPELAAWLGRHQTAQGIPAAAQGPLADAVQAGLVFAFGGEALAGSGLAALFAPAPQPCREIWVDGVGGFGVAVSFFAEPADPDLREFATDAFVRLGRHLESATFSRGLYAAYRDLEGAQERLVRTGKLAALGELATGVAHELRQPVTSINNFVHTLFDLVEQERFQRVRERLPEYRQRTERNIARMTGIIDHLRAFARDEAVYFVATDVGELLAGIRTTFFAGGARRRHIRFEWDVVPELPVVELDPQRIEQVLLHLLANACDAVEGGPDPTVSVSARLNEDGRLCLTVSDNGPGIPPALRERIFDPFFSTKPVGRGSGIGLSLAHGIVQGHNGEIAAEAAPGGGAAVSVTLPVRQPQRKAAALAAAGGK